MDRVNIPAAACHLRMTAPPPASAAIAGSDRRPAAVIAVGVGAVRRPRRRRRIDRCRIARRDPRAGATVERPGFVAEVVRHVMRCGEVLRTDRVRGQRRHRQNRRDGDQQGQCRPRKRPARRRSADTSPDAAKRAWHQAGASGEAASNEAHRLRPLPPSRPVSAGSNFMRPRLLPPPPGAGAQHSRKSPARHRYNPRRGGTICRSTGHRPLLKLGQALASPGGLR